MSEYLPASSDEFGTPWPLFNELHEEFNFTIDAAATKENAKLPLFVTKEMDAFKYDFTGHRVWCNPPYGGSGTVARWVEHFISPVLNGEIPLVAFLLPTKTEQKFFHEYCWGYAWSEVRFCKQRIKFIGGETSARDSHMVVIFRKRRRFT